MVPLHEKLKALLDEINRDRKGVKVRANDAGNGFFDIWYRGKHDKIYTGRSLAPEHVDWFKSRADLMAAEMRAGMFDVDKWRSVLGQMRRRTPITAKSEVTFQEYGEGPWYEHKKTKSEAKAQEYLKDLRIVCAIKIGNQGEKPIEFGAMKLGDMRPEHLDQLTNELRHRHGRKHATLTGTRMNTLLIKVVRSILDLSYARGYMSKNPHAWVMKQREEKPDIDPFSFDEMVALLGVFSAPKWVRYYTVAFGTGVRTSELIALQWPHVDFERKLVHIRQGFVNGRLTTLKTEGASRDIDMLPSVEEALRQQLEETKGQGRYVFSNTDGGPLHRDNMRNRVWNEAIKRAALKYRNPYQTRHTFASLMLEQGEDPAWVARMLRHTTMKMLYTRYGKFIRRRTRQDGIRFEAELQSARERSANHP
jgi:integrase